MTEIEAKFIVRRPAQVEELLRVVAELGYTLRSGGARTHVDTYFDTDDWSILRAGWTCRRRCGDDGDVLTLKSLGRADGSMFLRDEISQVTATPPLPVIDELPAGAVRDRLRELADGMKLNALFSVSTRRSVYFAAPPGADTPSIELDIDYASIDAPRRSEKASGVLNFTELELELCDGDPSAIEILGAALCRQVGLVPARCSKFERGLQAGGIDLTSILQPRQQLDFGDNDPVLALVFACLREQHECIRREFPRAYEGIDPEGVHQMRVAIRRLRAILRSFRGMLDELQVSKFTSELRWLARQLGRARDADVVRQLTERPGAYDTTDYERHLEEAANLAYDNLLLALDSRRFAVLMDELGQYVASGADAAIRPRHDTPTIGAHAERMVAALVTELLEIGNAITVTSPAADLHKLRIRIKRLRYLLDFFSTVQVTRWQPLIETTRQLQDVLGQHQDAVTALAQLADYAAAIPVDDEHRGRTLAVSRLMQREQDRIAQSRRLFPGTWSSFKASLSRSAGIA